MENREWADINERMDALTDAKRNVLMAIEYEIKRCDALYGEADFYRLYWAGKSDGLTKAKDFVESWL